MASFRDLDESNASSGGVPEFIITPPPVSRNNYANRPMSPTPGNPKNWALITTPQNPAKSSGRTSVSSNDPYDESGIMSPVSPDEAVMPTIATRCIVKRGLSSPLSGGYRTEVSDESDGSVDSPIYRASSVSDRDKSSTGEASFPHASYSVLEISSPTGSVVTEAPSDRAVVDLESPCRGRSNYSSHTWAGAVRASSPAGTVIAHSPSSIRSWLSASDVNYFVSLTLLQALVLI